jgi:hypothetical protein
VGWKSCADAEALVAWIVALPAGSINPFPLCFPEDSLRDTVGKDAL